MIKSRIRIISINLVLLLVVAAGGRWGRSALHPGEAKATTIRKVGQTGVGTTSVQASGTANSMGEVGWCDTPKGGTKGIK